MIRKKPYWTSCPNCGKKRLMTWIMSSVQQNTHCEHCKETQIMVKGWFRWRVVKKG
jgi:hypothetical protein